MDKSWKDSEAKKRWDKENTVRYSLKLNKRTDKAIISQIERMTGKDGHAQGAIKEMLRTLAERPKLAELIRAASKFDDKELAALTAAVERIAAGEDAQAVLHELEGQFAAIRAEKEQEAKE